MASSPPSRLTDGCVYIDKLVTFQGSRRQPVQLATIEAALVDLAAKFTLTRIRVESWQGAATVQGLQRLGLPVELVTPTPKLNSEEWPQLAQRLANGTRVLFPHARLREELLNLSVEVGPTGAKVTDRGNLSDTGIRARVGDSGPSWDYEAEFRQRERDAFHRELREEMVPFTGYGSGRDGWGRC